jgi:1-acylglycerone phosphate reductase
MLDLVIKVLALDVTDSTALKACVESVADLTGARLDILVSNAGIGLSQDCSVTWIHG